MFSSVEGFHVEDHGRALVLVKLTSIEHVAERGDQVDDRFDLEVTVSDGGKNMKGAFDKKDVKIAPGSSFTPNEFIFTGEYASENVGTITFKFEAETDSFAEVFVGETTGNNALKPGIQYFTAPVQLSGAAKTSTLVFRGRIDLS